MITGAIIGRSCEIIGGSRRETGHGVACYVACIYIICIVSARRAVIDPVARHVRAAACGPAQCALGICVNNGEKQRRDRQK